MDIFQSCARHVRLTSIRLEQPWWAQECLNKEGYFKSPLVPALWKHKMQPTQFVLTVNNYGIKYFTTEDLDHLINTLKKYYDVKVDPEGKELVKIELDWDYKNRKVHLSMKPYLNKSYVNSTMWFPRSANTLRIHMSSQNTEPNSNLRSTMNLIFKKWMANSFGTAEGLTAQSSPPSVQLQQNNQTQPFIQRNEANSSWTIWPRKNQQFSHIAKVKWCWRSTATPDTSMKRKPKAKPVASLLIRGGTFLPK